MAELGHWDTQGADILKRLLLRYYNICLVFQQKERKQIIIVCNHSQFQVKPVFLEQELRQALGDNPFWFGISISANSYKSLRSLYVNAIQRIFYSRHFEENNHLAEISLIIYQKCVHIFEENDMEEMRYMIREMIDEVNAFSDRKSTPEEIYRSFFCNVLLYIENQYALEGNSLIDISWPETARGELSAEILDKLMWLKRNIHKEINTLDEDRLIKKLRGYISQHYKEDMSLENLADYVGFHPSYVCTLFKKKAGLSYLECVHRERLKVAKQLLVDTDYNIDKIAEETGYNSASQFARVFRKYENISPTTFRSKRK